VDPDSGAFTVTGAVVGLCATTTITGVANGEMFTGHYTCDGGSGAVAGTKCLNGVLDPGEDCQDGNVTDGDCCSSRCRFEPAGSACTNDGNTCTDDVCDGAGTCAHPPNTASCEDGDACTARDVCRDGSCMPGAPVPGRTCAGAHSCEGTVARVLSGCIGSVGARMRRCYLATGAACPPDDPGTGKVLAELDHVIRARCPDAATVQALGFGASATPAAVAARIREACPGRWRRSLPAPSEGRRGRSWVVLRGWREAQLETRKRPSTTGARLPVSRAHSSGRAANAT